MTRYILATFLMIVALLNAQAIFAQDNQKGISPQKAAVDKSSSNNGRPSADTIKPSFDSSGNDADSLTEEFTFFIQNFKFNHQSELNTLNIKVQYIYQTGISKSQYPDFQLVLNDIKNFLTNYPDEEAYWEILNKELTLMVLQKYSVLSKITSEMQVSPSAMIPFTRSTIVTRQRSKPFKIDSKKSVSP